MLLAMDVGNTNISVGAFSGRRLAARGRLETRPLPSAGQLGRRLSAWARHSRVRVSEAVYGSVVPALDRPLETAVRRAFGVRPVRVGPRSRVGVRLRVRRPSEVGADRLLNALGAYELARGPAVVVDMGTATTFDCVSSRGDYLGGAILPGPRLAARALADHTAKLPLVPVARPRRAIGRDTVECIQAGLYHGYAGMIDRVLKRTLSEMRRGGARRPRVLTTGGLLRLFSRELPRGARSVPDLTLQGLRIAHRRLSAVRGRR